MIEPFLSRRQFLGRMLFVPWLPPFSQTPESLTDFIWSGAVTSTSARVKAKLRNDSSRVRLRLSRQPDLTAPQFSEYDRARRAENNRVVSLSMTNLQPDTQYYYAVEAEEQVDTTNTGSFKTFPPGPASFMCAFGSCAETGSTHPIFLTIRNLNPLFFIHLGDMHYRDIGINDRNAYRQAFEAVLASPTQAALYRSTPLVYMWDDHDYGRNDSDGNSRTRRVARLTYQEYMPHYPLVAGSGDVPIYQAFTVGRVRFILTDLRSERSPGDAVDNSTKSMLGSRQKKWLKQELLRAKTEYPLVVWLSSAAWIPNLSDGWHRYSVERRELANFIKTNDIKNLAMISGDLHMLGIDDGSHSDFATGGGAGFPVMQASPLDRFGLDAPAPYSHGPVAQRGQFGIMNVIDSGGPTVTVEWSGRNWANQELLAYRFTSPR